MATAKKAAPAAKAAPAKKAAPAAKATATAKAPAEKAAAPTKTAPAAKAASAAKAAPAKKTAQAVEPAAPAKKRAAKSAPAPEPKDVVAAPTPAPSPARKATPTKKETEAARPAPAKAIKGPGGYLIRATKDFDQKFLEAQVVSLLEERAKLTGQAMRLEKEANSLIEDGEMGDVQFDEEGGEGDTMVVERERDLALSAQNRQIVVEIDEALQRMAEGTYGYSVQSGQPIAKERLKFLPWASLRVDEKVGGIGRR